MKKNYFYLFLLLSTIKTFGQCSFNNTFYLNLTPTSAGTTVSDACVYGGDLVTVNVVAGQKYTISTCNSVEFSDSQITLYNGSGLTVLGYDDDFCAPYLTIIWVDTYTGVINVVVDEYPCLN